MDVEVHLGEEEALVAQQVLSRFQPHWPEPLSVHDLYWGWVLFVHVVEDGYQYVASGYVNSLEARSILQEVLDAIGDDADSNLAEMVAYEDERFRKATRRMERSIRQGIEGVAHHWWYNRIPIIFAEELMDNMRNEGVL